MSEAIYLAGQWGRRDEIAGYAKLLREDGHQIVSRWHDFLMGDDTAQNETDWRKWASADFEDIRQATTFVAFTEPAGTLSRGGRHVEWGYACTPLGPERIVVGPIESQFYMMRDWQFDDFAAAREMLAEPL